MAAPSQPTTPQANTIKPDLTHCHALYKLYMIDTPLQKGGKNHHNQHGHMPTLPGQTSHTVMRCTSCVWLAYHCRKVAKPSRPTLLGEEPAAPKLRLQLSRTRSCSAWMSLSRGLVSCRIASVPGPGGDAPASTPPHAGPCTTVVSMLDWQLVYERLPDGHC